MPNGRTAYCFTINNPQEQLDGDYLLASGATYGIWSEEVSDSGTHHFQGYIEFARRKTIKQIKKIAGFERAHLEPRRGSQEKAIAYASKINDETFVDGPYTFGNPARNNQGRRNDLLRVRDSLANGHSLAYVAEHHFSQFIRYHRGIQEYKRIVHPSFEEAKFKIKDFLLPKLKLNKAILLWGATGVGKTEYSIAHFDKCLFVRHVDALKNFSLGFHDGIVFDDMDFSHWPAGARIHLLDFDRPAEIHCRYFNGIIPAKLPRIFCANSPNIFYGASDTEEHRAAIDRRLLVLEIKEPIYKSSEEVKYFSEDEKDVAPTTTSSSSLAVADSRANFIDLTEEDGHTTEEEKAFIKREEEIRRDFGDLWKIAPGYIDSSNSDDSDEDGSSALFTL